MPAEEAEIRVREWLAAHEKEAKADPYSIRRGAVAKDIGVSTGNVSGTDAWKLFAEWRKTQSSRPVRTVPLTDKILASMPDEAAKQAHELAACIEEQQDEMNDDERGHKRGHKRHHDDRQRRHDGRSA